MPDFRSVRRFTGGNGGDSDFEKLIGQHGWTKGEIQSDLASLVRVAIIVLCVSVVISVVSRKTQRKT